MFPAILCPAQTDRSKGIAQLFTDCHGHGHSPIKNAYHSVPRSLLGVPAPPPRLCDPDLGALPPAKPERDLSRTSIFQVYFNLFSFSDQIQLPGSDSVSFVDAWLQSDETLSKFDLTLYAGVGEKEIKLAFVYNTDLFTSARITEMMRQFKHLLTQIVERPHEKIDSYSLVTTAAQNSLPDPRQLLVAHKSEAITALFSQQAQRFPNQPAVIDANETLTYRDLESRSNQLANYLIENGIQRGLPSPVGREVGVEGCSTARPSPNPLPKGEGKAPSLTVGLLPKAVQVAAVAAVLLTTTAAISAIKFGAFRVKPGTTKAMRNQMDASPGSHIVQTGWNAYSRIDCVEGLPGSFARLYIDSDAWTGIRGWDGRLESVQS